MIQHDHDTNSNFSSLQEEQDLFVPRYEYEHVPHPLLGNMEFLTCSRFSFTGIRFMLRFL